MVTRPSSGPPKIIALCQTAAKIWGPARLSGIKAKRAASPRTPPDVRFLAQVGRPIYSRRVDERKLTRRAWLLRVP